jgi:hypothetical protein
MHDWKRNAADCLRAAPAPAWMWEQSKTDQTIRLEVIAAPATGHVLDAPPVLMASDHSVDYTCGRCDTILLHAEVGQVHGLLIRCAVCGSHNATEP